MSGGNLCIWNSPEGQRDEAGTMVEERSNKRNGMVACEREGDGRGVQSTCATHFPQKAQLVVVMCWLRVFQPIITILRKIRYHDTTMWHSSVTLGRRGHSPLGTFTYDIRTEGGEGVSPKSDDITDRLRYHGSDRGGLKFQTYCRRHIWIIPH